MIIMLTISVETFLSDRIHQLSQTIAQKMNLIGNYPRFTN